jgi:type V secretory pathway adhesin AidA
MNRISQLALTCLFATTVEASANGDTATEAGVRDAENRWSEAFVSGDTKTLDALLDADYVSTGTNGSARPKAEIIRIAGAYAKAHPGEHAKPMAPSSTVRVIGNAAVVQHHGDSDASVDVFYFRNGRWHAWYSQHTKLGG